MHNRISDDVLNDAVNATVKKIKAGDKTSLKNTIAIMCRTHMLTKDERDESVCVRLFFETMLLTPMQVEMGLITREVMAKRGDVLNEYNSLERRSVEGVNVGGNIWMFHILNAIYNGAVLKQDEYCRALWQYLLQTYKRDEYNYIKNLKTIGVENLADMLGADFTDNMAHYISLLWCAHQVMNIEWDETKNGLAGAIEYATDWFHRERIVTSEKDDEASKERMKKIRREAFDTVAQWVKDDVNTKMRDYYKVGKYFDRVALNMDDLPLPEGNTPEDYLRFGYIEMRKMRIVKPTVREVQMMSHIIKFFDGILLNREMQNDTLCLLLGIQEMDGPNVVGVFDPSKIEYSDDVEEPEEETPVPEEMPENEELEFLRQENKRLRMKNNNLIAEIREVKEKIAKLSEKSSTAMQEEQKKENDKEEVVSSEEIVSYDEMVRFLRTKKVCILGGHDTYRRNFSDLFPEWLYLEPSGVSGKDASVLTAYDKVYIMTKYVSHASTNAVLSVVRTQNIPLGYLNIQNIEQAVRQIYEELKAED